MGVWTKVANFFALKDTDDGYEDDLIDAEPASHVVSFQDAKSSRKVGVSVFHPRRYDDVMEIGDNLRARMLVVVNLIGADRALSQRVVDFLGGVVFTLDGKMQRLAEGMYLFVPSNVHINAADAEVSMSQAY